MPDRHPATIKTCSLCYEFVRDEVLNQGNEVERHRRREGDGESEGTPQVLKNDVIDRAQLCCDDLVFEPLIL